MVEIFKACTIQSTISDSAHSDSNEQIDKINDYEEQVDAGNWLGSDSAEQVDQINDSDKQVGAIINDYDKKVDAISDTQKLVVTRSDPSSDPKLTTHTTNRNFAHKLLFSGFFQKIISVFIRPINTLITADVMGVQDILSLRQTVLQKSNITDVTRSCVRIFWGSFVKKIWTIWDEATSQTLAPMRNPD